MKRFLTVAACSLCFFAVTACSQKAEAPAEQAATQTEQPAQEAKAEGGGSPMTPAEGGGGTQGEGAK